MKRVKLICWIVLGITTVLGISACHKGIYSRQKPSVISSSPQSTDCQTISHAMGKTTLCGQPQRTIVLGPNALELLLDLSIQPIGFADQDQVIYYEGNYTNPKKQIPYLGQYILQPLVNLGIAYMPSIEKILKIQPDLIVGADGINVSQYQLLSQIAPTIILKWKDAEVNLRTVAQVFNRSKQAEERLLSKARNVKTVRKELSEVIAKYPKLLLLSSTGLVEQVSLGTHGHGRCSSLLKDLGFQLVDLPEYKMSQVDTIIPLSLEKLSELNQADHIVLLGSDFDPPNGDTSFENHQLARIKRAWGENVIAQKLTASKNGRVYFIPAYLFLGLPGTIGTKLYLEELRKQILNR
jgi:iron complex transport system substrate-binding protein